MPKRIEWVEGEARVAWILAGFAAPDIAAAFNVGVGTIYNQKKRLLEELKAGRVPAHAERFALLGLAIVVELD